MKHAVYLLITAAAFTLCLAANKKPAKDLSPHGAAIRLVLDETDLKKIDTQDWWHDTQTREWKVKRPFAPGIIDSTHMFNVDYLIDGKTVGSWAVDTRHMTVKPQID